MSGGGTQPATILSELGVKLPTLDDTHALSGGNTYPTKHDDWPEVDDWDAWTDFNYENLRSIFRPIVEAPWSNHPSDHRSPIEPMETELFDEKSVECHLTKHTMPLVNAALVRANNLLNQDPRNRGHLWASGRGGGITGRPDWSLCSPSQRHSSGKYVNLLPGDTKLSRKWVPNLKERNESEWALPVRQVMSYSRDLGVWYGFIITDHHLVVLRFSRFEIGDGIARSRLRRVAAPSSQTSIQPSGHSRSPSTASNTSGGAGQRPPSRFSDSEPTNEWQPPQFCAIPWSNHNLTVNGKPSGAKAPVLTVRLGLFYLSLLALCGPDTAIRYDYPPLDSWIRTKAGYVHNSSGKKVTSIPENATVVERATSPPGSQSGSSRSSSSSGGNSRVPSQNPITHQPTNRGGSTTRTATQSGTTTPTARNPGASRGPTTRSSVQFADQPGTTPVQNTRSLPRRPAADPAAGHGTGARGNRGASGGNAAGGNVDRGRKKSRPNDGK
ncbi:hypothetical protein B0J18DRAFT_82782 [Chaetomium sp. MPI-SDFR-AT-0129]|nr:hypothetical protein B0J18DRAFT_82782 [Chaetomium sp. MPI-SDFR-AT-0129]